MLTCLDLTETDLANQALPFSFFPVKKHKVQHETQQNTSGTVIATIIKII
jgi:hypothetical protein